MNSGQMKIQFLVRTEKRRVALPAFLAAASETIGETIQATSVIDISSTDERFKRFCAGYQSALKSHAPSHRRLFRSEEESKVLYLTDSMAEQLTEERAIWLTNVEGEQFAFEIQLAGLLRCAKSAIWLDRNSLSAISIDGSQGLLLDWNPDDLKQNYELVFWGNRWSAAIHRCVD